MKMQFFVKIVSDQLSYQFVVLISHYTLSHPRLLVCEGGGCIFLLRWMKYCWWWLYEPTWPREQEVNQPPWSRNIPSSFTGIQIGLNFIPRLDILYHPPLPSTLHTVLYKTVTVPAVCRPSDILPAGEKVPISGYRSSPFPHPPSSYALCPYQENV